MSRLGTFVGIGVGPGPAKLLPVAALEALNGADVVYAPRARSADFSIARHCLAGLSVSPERIREITFTMDPDRTVLRDHYAALAQTMADELARGMNIAYLTIGDALTYSTYGYLLAALRERMPQLRTRTIPGVTSFAAAAAAFGWPIGEGKERVLILPCPDDADALRVDIESHDVVILMKIGKRLPWVLALLHEMGIAPHCALASRVGLADEVLCPDVSAMPERAELGYLSTMLIRRTAREPRRA